MIEAERKYLNVDFGVLRSKLQALGARSFGAHFETNVIFDQEGQPLLKAASLLRLRLQEWPMRHRCVMTLKTPSDSDDGCSRAKVREELETEIGDFSVVSQLFGKLGYQPVARYEKVREEWRVTLAAPDGNCFECAVDLDEISFSRIVEIEASPQYLDFAANSLGLNQHMYSVLTYHQLHLQWLMDQGLAENPNILFKPDHKRDLRRQLGLPN